MSLRISGQSLATIFLATLLIITLSYYIFPENDDLFAIFGIFLGMIVYILITVAILSVSISIIKLISKHIRL